MTIKVITPPAMEPVTLAQARTHLRAEEIEEEDSYIEGLISTAREWCEGFQNKAYLSQTIEKVFDCFPPAIFDLPRPPMVTVESIKYYDIANVEYLFDSDLYFVDTISEPGRVSLNYAVQWPTLTLRPINSVIVRYIAGVNDAAAVPKKVIQAILLLVGHWYNQREPVGEVSGEMEFAVKSLLGQDRVRPT